MIGGGKLIGRLVKGAVLYGIFTTAPPAPYCPPVGPPPAPYGAQRGPVRGFLYQAARPIFDPSSKGNLYISGYAGRRPVPRDPRYSPSLFAPKVSHHGHGNP